MPLNFLGKYDNSVSTLIRASTALTSNFVSCTVVNIQGANRLCLDCKFTKGNASGLAIQIKTSRASTGANYWKRELEQEQTGSGTTYYRPNTRYIRITTTSQTPFHVVKELDCVDKWAKVYVKGFTHCTGAAVRVIAIKANI